MGVKSVAVKEFTEMVHDIGIGLKERDRGNGRGAAIKPNSGGEYSTLQRSLLRAVRYSILAPRVRAIRAMNA
jgi:hypothetical protein